MKTILLFLVMLLPLVSTAQPMFGYSPSEIRQQHSDVSWSYNKWGNDKDKMVMQFQTDDLQYSYFFNEDNISIYTFIAPLTQGMLQTMVELYNQRYVIVNKNEWRLYKDGSIYTAKLLMLENEQYYFMWTIE
jgi:hypothetical protein